MARKSVTPHYLGKSQSFTLLSLQEVLANKILIENVSDGFQILDSKWNFIYINKKAEKLIGIKRSEIIGKNIWRLYPHLTGTKFETEYFKAVELKKIREFDEYSSRIDKYFRVRAVPIKEGLLVYFNDVTNEKSIEQTLEYQRLLLNAQKEVSPEGILIVSESGKIFSYNKRFAKMWNLPKQVLSSKLDELLLQKAHTQLVDPEGFINRVGEIYLSKKKSRDKLYFKNGNVYDRHGSPIIGKDKKYYGYVWFFLDITDRERAIQTLAENEEKYRLVVENTSDLINLVDKNGKYLYVNPSYTKIFGYKIKELIGKNAFDFVHPEDVKQAKSDFKRAVNEGMSVTRLRFLHKDNYYRMIEGTRTRVTIDKNFRMIVTIFRDITDKVELDKRKDEFINMASHELRTPITSLSLYTELLRKKLADNTSLLPYIEKMDSQVWRMGDLIKDLLDLSRIQTGKLVYRDEKFSLIQLVTEVSETMQQTTDHQKVNVKPFKEIFLVGDRNRISQVLINLISNAIKYSRRNTKVDITVRQKDSSVIISVRDYGLGISKEHQKRIFERFYQVSEQSKKVYPGLGIGLHISSEIIKRHKGTIWVNSIKGKGSTFSFSLPI